MKTLGSIVVSTLVLAAPFSSVAEVSFNRDIRPILADTCYHCHGPDSAKQFPKSKPLRLNSFEAATKDRGGYAAIVPKDAMASELIKRIFSADADEVMPPPDSHRSLTEPQKSLLRQWIDEGAKYEAHWAFLPPVKAALPAVSDAGWVKIAIDSFVLARLDAERLKPNAEAVRETLIRRATQTLTGLPPTPAEVDAFLAESSSEAYDKLLDRLLDSERYGERMAFFWLEAARYADTDGYQTDGGRTMWPWRDWVIKAFNDNMPFDEFSVKQLAGDMLPGNDVQNVLASAFNRNHRLNNEGGALPEEFIVEYAIDRVETTGTVWMGLTAGCARCHDHKYDPLSQKEFYQLYAYFNSISERGKAAASNAPPQITIASPLEDPAASQSLADKRAELATAKAALTDKQQLHWEAGVANPDDKKLAAALKVPHRKRNAKQKALIREHFEQSDPSLKVLTSEIATLSTDLTEVNVLVMKESAKPTPTYRLDRGQYTSPDKSEVLKRGIPASLNPNKSQPKDRLEFARWLASRDNPLGARVLVNRIWQQHFGIGIVKTPENFGLQGAAPSHPKLLDWLAVDLMENGWDLKRLHKMILSSTTWRQASQAPPSMFERDPQNQLLARGPRFRLDASAIRDGALFASGLLDDTIGGPPARPYQPKGLWSVVASSAGTTYKTSKGRDLYRRGLYTYWKRAVNPPRMLIFDAATREYCMVARNATNTPLQALVLMNDVTFVEAARALAERMMKEAGTTVKARLDLGFRLAVGTKPNAAERQAMHATYEDFKETFGKDSEAARAFLAQGSSSRDETLDPIEHAAFTAAAHLALNLDRSIHIE